jgi:endonuclease YncB( thermonuclease family)
MNAPAGWYPTDHGNLRYWDGVQWTEHVAPFSTPVSSALATDSRPARPVPATAAPSAAGVATWAGWGGLVVFALLGATSTGVSGVFIMAAIYVLVVALLALVRGRVTWARLRGRAAGGVALGAAMGLFILGGATADPPPSTTTAATPARPATPTPERTVAVHVYRSADAAGYTDQRDTADAQALAAWAASHGIGASSSSSTDSTDLWLAAVQDYPGSSEVPALVTTAHTQRLAAEDAYSRDDMPTADAAHKAALATRTAAQTAMTADFDAALAKAGPATAYRAPLSGAYLEVASLASTATVLRWLDGDTVETDRGRVRLVGVDTPEVTDECSRADKATANAERLAPRGAVVTLRDPSSVQDTDKYGRLLRYVEVNGHDVGYSQIREGLGVARYDGTDGYDSHPRQAAYHAASQGKPSEDPRCYAAAAAAAAWLLAADDEEHHLWVLTPGQEATTRLLLNALWDRTNQVNSGQLSDARQAAELRIKAKAKAAADAAAKEAAARAKAKAAAKAKAEAAAEEARKEASNDTGGGSSSSSDPYPGYTGPRCYAPGGKTWKPC